MASLLFPLGWMHYLAGGLVIGAGVALLFILTGRIAGMSSVFCSSWSFVSRRAYFQQPGFVASRGWRVVMAKSLVACAALWWGLAGLAAGMLFGFGLAWSTMVSPEVVLSFLRFQDWGLMLVMGGAVAVALPVYQFAPKRMRKPAFGDRFEPHRLEATRPTLVGAVLFGIGWGLCGVCPGPAIASLGVGNWPTLYVLAGLLAGAWLQGRVADGARASVAEASPR